MTWLFIENAQCDLSRQAQFTGRQVSERQPNLNFDVVGLCFGGLLEQRKCFQKLALIVGEERKSAQSDGIVGGEPKCLAILLLRFVPLSGIKIGLGLSEMEVLVSACGFEQPDMSAAAKRQTMNNARGGRIAAATCSTRLALKPAGPLLIRKARPTGR